MPLISREGNDQTLVTINGDVVYSRTPSLPLVFEYDDIVCFWLCHHDAILYFDK